MLPIIFIHNGYTQYLEFTLRQCRLLSPHSNIILIGDSNNNKFPWVNHINSEDLISKDIEELEEDYIHLSPNEKDYELFCLKRWLLLKNYCLKYNIQEVFTCDSDVMIYKDINQYKGWLSKSSNTIAAYCIPHQSKKEYLWAASAHTSYWKAEGLEKFCSFLVSVYKSKDWKIVLESKYKAFVENKHLGGVSDMTLLYLFHINNTKLILNLLEVKDNEVFDLNFSMDYNLYRQEYRTDSKGYKLLVEKNGIYYGFNNFTHQEIVFSTIHFQGATKFLIPKFYKGAFIGFISIKYYIINIVISLLEKNQKIYSYVKALAIRYKLF